MKNSINKAERAAMVRAMEFIVRQINDEEVFEPWLIYGVADGDIDETTTNDEIECYIDDRNFAELMGLFLRLMSRADKSGGLYCDGVVSE